MSISAQAHRMIEARRKQDSNYREMDNIRAQNQKSLQIANFEITTSNKIDKKSKQLAFNQMKRNSEISLLERQRRLAEMYNSEMEQWQAEALARVETQEDRKARIMERAYALRDARDNQRMAYVKDCYNRQWRDACDDARSLDSQAFTVHTSNERLAQIEEKRMRKIALSVEETAFVESWKRQLAIMEEKNKLKEDMKKQVDLDMQKGIQEQMINNQLNKQSHFNRTRAEEDIELAKLRDEIQAEANLQRKKQENDRARGQEVRRVNEEYKYYQQEQKMITQQQDSMLLEYALRKERELNEAEEAKRNANKLAAMKYQKYLEEQMIREAEDSAFMDEVCKREEEKVWKARDDALQARQDARDELMRQVDEGRQVQIKSKYEQDVKEKEEGKIFAARFLEEARLGMERDKIQLLQRRLQNVENKDQLIQHISIRRQKEEMEKQESYLADKQMKHMERLHKQKLTEQGGQLRTNFPLKSGQWYS